MVNKVIEKVKYVREKYPNLFKEFNAFKKIMDFGGNEKTLKPGEIPETFACGAGRSSIHLNSKGNIQLCAISESCGFPSFGNILNNSLEKVMSTKIAKLSSISPAPTPKFCSVSCKNFFFCGGCIARGYNKFLKEKENCSWGQKFYN
ncbi:MAG: hypothetical protein QME25_02850 [Bacteroidota bacterium]|nr:hypothetical protein [Bacteroidota bacterium]